MLEALTAQLQALAQAKPVLMIFEDVHWIDPTSLEAVGRTVDWLTTLGVLLIVTYRPEFEPPWIGRPYVTVLSLNRLGQREITEMIDRVTGNKALPESTRQDIIERTDGIPLFVEEMTRAVLEAAEEGVAERAIAATPRSSIAVPASLHASLMARLDRLGSAKEVGQIGAVIGRQFSHDLIAAVARMEEPKLCSALDRLIDAGLLFRQGIAPHATYLFKHALVQDAAYGTLLRDPRRALHARIAETIGSKFADVAENQPELVARHCTEAGLIEKAALLWGKAGQRSLERSALVEAVEQLTRALDQVATLPGTPALRREQIKLQAALITPLVHVKGFAAVETRAATERLRLLIEQADALGEPAEDPLLLFSVLYGFWTSNFVAFNGDIACDLAAQFLALAEKQGSTPLLMVGHRLIGMSLAFRGNIVEGRTHLDRGVALYDAAQQRPLAARFGVNSGVSALVLRAVALWVHGYPDLALADADHALSNAREIGQAATLMYALCTSGAVHIFSGDYSTAKVQSDEVVLLAGEKGTTVWKGWGMINSGGALALTGKASEAIDVLTSGMAVWRSTGATLYMPWFASHVARAYADLGQFNNAWNCIGEAMKIIETFKEKIWESEVNRVAGKIALMSREPDTKAEAYFEQALAVARRQQAKSWELRAAMSLARLWRDQGKVQQARELLAPVYGWFAEGFDTLDLREAKALLEELAA
jgi:predicted ATPase